MRKSKKIAVGIAILSATSIFLFQNFSSVESTENFTASAKKSCAEFLPAAEGTYTKQTNLVYTRKISTEPGTPQALDYWRPNGSQSMPLLIYVHGGGWQNGSKTDAAPRHVAQIMLGKGYAVANFNYPLVRTLGAGPYIDQFPIPIQALRCGMRYLNKNAAALGIDTSRVVVFGASAGGNLAGMLAYADADSEALDSPDCEYRATPMLPVKVLVANAGVYRLRLLVAFNNDGAVHYLGDPTCDPDASFDAKGIFIGETVRCRNIRWNKGYFASPYNYVTANSVQTFAVHTIDDPTVNYQETIDLDEILTLRGVRHQTVTFPAGSGHAVNFLYSTVPALHNAGCQMFQFLNSALR